MDVGFAEEGFLLGQLGHGGAGRAGWGSGGGWGCRRQRACQRAEGTGADQRQQRHCSKSDGKARDGRRRGQPHGSGRALLSRGHTRGWRLPELDQRATSGNHARVRPHERKGAEPLQAHQPSGRRGQQLPRWQDASTGVEGRHHHLLERGQDIHTIQERMDHCELNRPMIDFRVVKPGPMDVSSPAVLLQ